MSSPEDTMDNMDGSSHNSRLKAHYGNSPSLSTSSEPGNERSNHSADMVNSASNVAEQPLQTNSINNNNSVENESDISLPAELVNGETANNRKPKKRKAKRSKQRRASREEALMGWSGPFPNLMSTHSLESNSDLDQQKAKRLKKNDSTNDTAICTATDAVEGLAAATTEDSNGSSSGSLQNRGSRKRAISTSATPSEQHNEPKRIKNSEQQDVGCSLRTRSKSLHDPNPEVISRATRARSVCAAVGLNQSEPAQLTPPSSGPKTPTRRRSVAAFKLPPTDDFYFLPFKYGWKRELVLRSNASNSRQRGDVIFISPGGKKLRSREDIIPLLRGELTIDHFCFQRQMQQAGEQYETVRQAQPAPLRRKSLATAKQQPQLVTSHNSQPLPTVPAPVTGKRVPKPKVPKGASPPPEGWTSTMAVKGNARVLAASNGNTSSAAGSTAGNSARKRNNQAKQSASAKTAAEPTAPAKLRPQPATDKIMICVYCLQPINENHQAYPVGTANNYVCKRCVKPGSKTVNVQQTAKGLQTAHGLVNGTKKQELVDENINSNSKSETSGDASKTTTEDQNANGNGGLLEIGGEIELPGALPPDQLLSDEAPADRAGNKITPKPLEVVVINGRKALAIAGEPPRPRLQVVPREPDLEIYERHFPKRISSAKEKRQSFVECISSGNFSCQVMSAVMKTLDLHDRVRMASVCKTWAMIARDRSVWRSVKLRDTHITNWVFLLRDMVRYRTHELDMIGVKMDNSKMRMDGDLRVLKTLRILRTDACEAEFIQTVIKRMPRLLELRTTCTSRALSLQNMEKMMELRVLRIRMVEPKASIVSLQPLQKLEQLRELSLRGINNMAQLELLQLNELKQLETLVLGSCRGMKVTSFGQVLSTLQRLRYLRLENHHSNRSFNINEIMEGIAAGGSVERVELINVNVDAELSQQLAKCQSVQELLLMPNFHNNTAYMMRYIMQAINENSEQLNVFRLGLTYELLSVTRALAMNHEKDCIPVALPIPGVPDNDVLNESDEPIAYLPVDRLESILHHMMPQAWLTVAKVSQGETTNLKFLSASPTETAGILNT